MSPGTAARTATIKIASRVLTLAAILAVYRAPVVAAVSCPGTYTAYSGKCFKYINFGQSRSDAHSACHNDENGWLATLDTTALATGVVTEYGITVDTYIGLYKGIDCNSPLTCQYDLLWDYAWNGGPPASSIGKTANMLS